ncbi:MAG: hypothetical protein V7K27_01990 [Nostoc sp.]|uniref:hypothetical protein n=1 Tax=Nostoc sp. TaxID=1180 RepID=UPI002FF7EE00
MDTISFCNNWGDIPFYSGFGKVEVAIALVEPEVDSWIGGIRSLRAEGELFQADPVAFYLSDRTTGKWSSLRSLFFWTKALAAAILTKLQTAIAKMEALTALLEWKAEVDEVFRREIKKRGLGASHFCRNTDS